MPIFRYKAASVDGQVDEGRIEAQDRDSAARTLQRQGKVPIQIDSTIPEAVAATPAARLWRPARAAGRTDIDLFTLELATLLRAGLPLGQALDTLTGLADSPAMAKIANDVNTAVRGGKPLSVALEQSDDQALCPRREAFQDILLLLPRLFHGKADRCGGRGPLCLHKLA